MSTVDVWPWAAIVLLGAWHGLNPGMGWLFAVALGLQERRSRAVWRALAPLALGHGLAIALAVALGGILGLVLPADGLRWLVAAVLAIVGVDRLARRRHPRFGGMRMGARDLTIWSLLMASAHGAGLMVLPFVHGMADGGAALGGAQTAAGVHVTHAASVPGGLSGGQLVGLLATVFHTVGYLGVTGLVAVLVYERLGLRLLRRAWVNLDLVWGMTLVLTAVATPLL